MAQIRIECPKCTTQGKLDSKAVPGAGANIRCPSRGAVFFVKAPDEPGSDAASPAAGATAAGAPAAGTGPTDPAPAPSGDASETRRGTPSSSDTDGPSTAPIDRPSQKPATAPGRPAGAMSVPRLSIPGFDEPPPDTAIGAPARNETSGLPTASNEAANAPDDAGQAADEPAVAGESDASEAADSPSGARPGASSAPGGDLGYDGVSPMASDPEDSQSLGRTITGYNFAAGLASTADPETSQQPSSDGSFRVSASPVTVGDDDEEDDVGPHVYHTPLRTRRVGATSQQDPASEPTDVLAGDDIEPVPADHTADHPGPWRVRATSGMVYDFPDTSNLRAWLETRTSHIGLAASSDGGETFKALALWPELAGVRARGFRATTTRIPITVDQSPSTGVTPAVPSGRPHHRTGAAKTLDKKARTTERSKSRSRSKSTTTKVRASKKKEQESSGRGGLIARVVVLLCILVGATFGAVAYNTGRLGPRIPDTPAGDELLWILSAMNGAAPMLTVADVERHFAPSALSEYPAPRIIEALNFWYGRYAGYEFMRINGDDTDTFLEVVVNTPLSEKGVITIMVEELPPNRIVEFRVRPYN